MNRKINKITRKCYCGKQFKIWPADIKKGGGKYCSQRCYYKRPVRQVPYQRIHGFSSKKNPFMRDRWHAICVRLKVKCPEFKPSYLSKDLWALLMLCEIAGIKLGIGRKIIAGRGHKYEKEIEEKIVDGS